MKHAKHFSPIKSPHLVSFEGDFKLKNLSHDPPPDAPKRHHCEQRMQARIEEMQKLQSRLYADDAYALLLVFQAMDAAGKDGTIRAVMTGINPAGCQVFSFKKPSAEELDHDFLWRTTKCLPERGRIGIFNRSYYEDVLVQRVHPEWLKNQRVPGMADQDPAEVFEGRYDSIRDHERHLARNGTVILKFFLNVSKEEQRQRFLDRINEPKSNWKFSSADIQERGHWSEYMEAYETALKATSRPWAPWYAIPADNKPYMRLAVCDIIAARLESLDLSYPKVGDAQRAVLGEVKKQLEAEA
ncbi:MAG: polyphosphate kinase 2 family protein [Deltaproteobacteria bacterium]|nr:polyphosphate kinase 2 family protein [Deltaproteobacteria bacterium]